RAGKANVERPGVGDIGEVEPNDLAARGGEMIARLSVHEENVPEAAHQRVGADVAAKRNQPLVTEKQIVEDQRLFPVGGAERVRALRTDEQIAIEPEILLDVLPDVRMVPVDPRVAKTNLIGEAAARLDRILSDPGRSVAPIVQPNAVPVNRGRLI